MWGKVAAGMFDAETAKWLSEVAAKVIAADKIKDGNLRSGALASATGISGRSQPHNSIVFSIVCLESEIGTGPKPTAVARDRLVSLHGWHNLSSQAIDKRLDRAIAEVGDPATRARLRAIIGRRAADAKRDIKSTDRVRTAPRGFAKLRSIATKVKP